MFYFYSTIIFSLLLLIGIVIYLNTKKTKQNHEVYHYYIIVKNGEVVIEGVIRSLNFSSVIKGHEKKITVFDLGSDDDTMAILERFTYRKTKIDNLYRKESNKVLEIGELFKESIQNKEKPVIIYINTQDNSPIIKIFQDDKLNLVETS